MGIGAGMNRSENAQVSTQVSSSGIEISGTVPRSGCDPEWNPAASDISGADKDVFFVFRQCLVIDTVAGTSTSSGRQKKESCFSISFSRCHIFADRSEPR